MRQSFEQQLKQLEKQEYRLLNKPENPILRSTITPVTDKIQEIIPDKLRSTLNAAFYKGFQLVFEKGVSLIEKTYDKEKIAMDFDVNNYAVDKNCNKRYIKRLDKQSKQSGLVNTSISAVEGGVLGLLGIGLPDIPLFLAVIMKTINEIALSYGFSYDTPEEKAYMLLLIRAAIAKDIKQKDFDQELDQLSAKIDQSIVPELDLDSQMKETSDTLSDVLLTAKFIQGIPIVGVVGGAVNYTILNKIGNYAKIKYKKRYLLKKLSR